MVFELSMAVDPCSHPDLLCKKVVLATNNKNTVQFNNKKDMYKLNVIDRESSKADAIVNESGVVKKKLALHTETTKSFLWVRPTHQ